MKANAILGGFVFAIETAMFQEIERITRQKFSTQSRVGARDAHQHLGPGDDTATLPGYILPIFNGAESAQSLDQLRDMQATGDAYIFIRLTNGNATGQLKGKWVIEEVEEKQSEFFGAYPQRIDFVLTIKRIS